MDINILRSAVTVVSLLLFLALVAWTWSRQRRAAFDDAAKLPFVDSMDSAAAQGERRDQ
jgi:cytochrome c oxidase cbb3-type subunit IV